MEVVWLHSVSLQQKQAMVMNRTCVRPLGSARAIPAAFFEIEKATMVKAHKSRRAVALRLLDQDSELKMVMMCCGDQFASVFLPTLLGRQ